MADIAEDEDGGVILGPGPRSMRRPPSLSVARQRSSSLKVTRSARLVEGMEAGAGGGGLAAASASTLRSGRSVQRAVTAAAALAVVVMLAVTVSRWELLLVLHIQLA